MKPINKEVGDTTAENPTSAEGTPTIDSVRKLLAEGKELPPGWTITSNGHPVPPGDKINSMGIVVPGDDLNREDLKEEVEKLKDEVKSAKSSLKRIKKIRQLEIDNAGNDNQKVANAVASIAKHEGGGGRN